MLTSIKGFIAKYKMYIYMAVLAAVFSSGVTITRMYYVNKEQALIIKLQEAEGKLAVAVANVEIKYIKEIVEVEGKTKWREKKVVVYLPQEKATNGLVEFHNAAVENRELNFLEASQIQAYSSVDMSTFGSVINNNYSLCNKHISQITALQDIVRLFEKTYGVKE